MHSLPAEYRLKFALGTQLVLKLVKRNDLKGSRDSGGEQLTGAPMPTTSPNTTEATRRNVCGWACRAIFASGSACNSRSGHLAAFVTGIVLAAANLRVLLIPNVPRSVRASAIIVPVFRPGPAGREACTIAAVVFLEGLGKQTS
jgi:hypothetical protein